MFSCLHSSGSLALRLPEDERKKFLKKYKTTLFESYGVVQKEYVTVPESLLKKTRELQPYFALSYGYVRTLKPKASKKKSWPDRTDRQKYHAKRRKAVGGHHPVRVRWRDVRPSATLRAATKSITDSAPFAPPPGDGSLLAAVGR